MLCCFSLLLSAITEPVLLPSSLFITLGQTPTQVLINSPSHRLFQLIYATTHSIIRMGSLKVVDLERELAYLWLDGGGGYGDSLGTSSAWVWGGGQ